MEKNDCFENVPVTALSSDGAGVCRIGGRAAFLPGALPGEERDVPLVKVTSAAVLCPRRRRM